MTYEDQGICTATSDIRLEKLMSPAGKNKALCSSFEDWKQLFSSNLIIDNNNNNNNNKDFILRG